MTTNDDPTGVSVANNFTNNSEDRSHVLEGPEWAQLDLEKQQRAKELTEIAAATTNPEERENLIRQALDCEVEARTQSFRPNGATLQVTLEEPETADVIDIGPEALTGPLLDLASTAVLQDTIAEVGAGLNAVGGWVYNVEGESEAEDANGLAPSPSTTVPSLEAALPAIEEVLGVKTPTPVETHSELTMNVDPGADIPEAPTETSELLPTSSNETESVTLTEGSIKDDRSPEFELTTGSDVDVLEVIETTVSTPETPEKEKPRRKPRKLEIKAKKKPRKLEIRSDKKSP